MTKNLFDLSYELASELGYLEISTVTSATSTTTFIDTQNRSEPDNYWNFGEVYILKDAGGAGAAPEGESKTVSDFDNATSTVTLVAAFSQQLATSDLYAIGDKKYTSQDIASAINRAIRDVGPIPTTDTTSIDTAAAQTEYTLPIAANTDLREVWIETNISDADDNQWAKTRNWYVQRTDVGTADTLVFPEQPPYPRDVKLVYMAPHVLMWSNTDKLSETIRWERVIYRAAVHALNHYRIKTHNTDEYFLQTIQDYERRADQADLMYPVKAPRKMGNIMLVGVPSTVELAPGENTIP